MKWKHPRRRFTHDLWAPLSHIPEIGGNDDSVRPLSLPTWVDETDARRLMAYRVLTSYRTNVRRMFLPDEMWQRTIEPDASGIPREVRKPAAESTREYGHGALLVDTARSIVLGEAQTTVIPALKDTDPEDPALAGVRAAQDWLTGWATSERLQAKLLIQEANTVGDGDGVHVLAWSADQGRPTLRVYDPGFYFPDLLALDTMPGWSKEYPPIVHLAWEYEAPDGVMMLRRHSWRMTKLAAPVPAPWGGDRAWTCLYETAEWRIDRLKEKVSVYALRAGSFGGSILKQEDLGVDFIPVVHIPNTESGEHFGAATPMIVAQILDDLSFTDTDNAHTAETSAAPPASFTGAGGAQPMPSGPGAAWWTDAGSTAGFIDTSRVLDAGLKHKRNLLEDLAINTRLGLALLGRVVPSDVPSGFALQLGFAPAQSMLREMRLVRREKHPLILKFALRLAQARGAIGRGETPAAEIDLGAALPTDLAVVIDQATALLAARAISTGTAVRMLMGAGLPIQDAEDEVQAIRRENFAAAVQLVDATGRADEAEKMLGLDPATPAPAHGDPNPDIPPAPDPNE